MPAMNLKNAKGLSLEPFGGVLVEAVGPIATQTRHGEGADLYLRSGLHLDGTGRGPTRLELGELFARRHDARVPHNPRAIVVHARCKSVDHPNKLGTLAPSTRPLRRSAPTQAMSVLLQRNANN
jgi:hypothetical protein